MGINWSLDGHLVMVEMWTCRLGNRGGYARAEPIRRMEKNVIPASENLRLICAGRNINGFT